MVYNLSSDKIDPLRTTSVTFSSIQDFPFQKFLNRIISGMEPKGQPNEQMEEVVLQPTQPKLVSTEHIETLNCIP